jgi:hypothetical protein
MKAPAQVVAPIHRMSAWQQEERMTYLEGLKDCSDDNGEG